MGRIAYLSKRGNIWWFRRRHPVIFITTPHNDRRSAAYVENEEKAQAKGHLALSLQTSSKREARLLSAQVSFDFERAWAFVEAHMSETDTENDMLDGFAMVITTEFRSYISTLRSDFTLSLDHRVKETAYNILEADLRNALGVNATPQPVSFEPSQNEDAGPNDGFGVTDPMEIAAIEAEMAIYEENGLLSSIPREERTQDDYYAEHIINDFGALNHAYRVTLTQYIEACEQLGLDPRTATPDFENALKEALKTAKAVGLAQEKVSIAE
tara:strand:- start:166 stop:972 length:807 start_codon:yes stop_codon:yes gene_type:complete